MCQRFIILLFLFTGITCLYSKEYPAPREGLWVRDSRGFTVLQVANDGRNLGWIDISNKTLISPTGRTGRLVTLVNYEKPNRPSYTLGTSLNMSTRKFVFRAHPPKHIACYIGPQQVNCTDVINIIFYYPYHNAFDSMRYNDLELA